MPGVHDAPRRHGHRDRDPGRRDHRRGHLRPDGAGRGDRQDGQGHAEARQR